jgi:hypothetical protein
MKPCSKSQANMALSAIFIEGTATAKELVLQARESFQEGGNTA